MKFKILLLFIIVLVHLNVTVAAPKASSKETPKVGRIDRTEIFKRALAYLPSIMFSVMDKIQMTKDEKAIFIQIANLATQNLNLDNQQEFILPDKYKLFVVKETSDQRYFDLNPNETVRTASTVESHFFGPGKSHLIGPPKQEFYLG